MHSMIYALILYFVVSMLYVVVFILYFVQKISQVHGLFTGRRKHQIKNELAVLFVSLLFVFVNKKRDGDTV